MPPCRLRGRRAPLLGRRGNRPRPRRRRGPPHPGAGSLVCSDRCPPWPGAYQPHVFSGLPHLLRLLSLVEPRPLPRPTLHRSSSLSFARAWASPAALLAAVPRGPPTGSPPRRLGGSSWLFCFPRRRLRGRGSQNAIVCGHVQSGLSGLVHNAPPSPWPASCGGGLPSPWPVSCGGGLRTFGRSDAARPALAHR